MASRYTKLSRPTFCTEDFSEMSEILYWCFVDFEKAFDSINREALWYKMRKWE
jgi:hypothetical protein